jgi:HTH-type transcriptional regulator / antitoxin HigA
MKLVKRIENDGDYTIVMTKIDSLMAKGSENVSKEELAEIGELALAAQVYEQQKYDIIDANFN